MTGLELIAAERLRQVEQCGWTPEHDDQHDAGELAVAGALLATYPTDAFVEDPLNRLTDGGWMVRLAERHRDNPVRILSVAGALIAAEIDRLLRAESP